MFIAVTLVANAVLTGINLYLVFQFNQNLSRFEYQSTIPSSTSFMVARADDADLGNPVVYFGQQGMIEQTVHYGVLKATFEVAIAHYGTLTVNLRSLNVTESEYLNPQMLNETEVSYSDQKTSQVYVLVPGFNQINTQLPLKAQVYPISGKIPSNGESVKVMLGNLTLQAQTFDFETQAEVTREFSTDIFIELENPA